MRISVFSDIHSNSIAFKACLERAEAIGFDACILLGDYVSDCAYPERTMELINGIKEKYPVHMIIGNREEYLLNHLHHPEKDNWQYNSQTGSLLYTFENLSKASLLSFENMPIYKKIDLAGYKPFEICHGTIHKSRASVLPGRRDADEAFLKMETDLLVLGHTHTMFIMNRHDKTIANGGPVGVPSDNTPGASFLMLETTENGWTPSIHKTEYDIHKVYAEIDESGLIHKANVWARGIKAMLKTGREYLLEVLEIVHVLSHETGLSASDERLWQEAARRLHI